MTACARPGCTGSIADGYCDVCGLAPAGRTASAPGADSGSERFDVSRLTTRTASSGPTARRSRVGAGVIDLSPVQVVDPATVVMADPSVPEDRRFCTRCEGPVGRGKDGRPGRQAGFCPSCGARFDFAAKLQAGELVAGQYQVVGALAHGGLGWIYLARDRNVSDRWCVLKGLLDAADPDAAEAAVAERRFLAEVAHPAIVEIFNFVNHDGQGYIVMEYVGGPSLKQLAKRRRQDGHGPMPAPDAAAFILAVLPAVGFLHDRGLVYCDFKPDNVIHVGDAVKLIDLGGVRRLDDPDAAIFGTVGYQAPEVADVGPTIASDLYTVGRALAVLILDWPTWQTSDRERLPDREAHPLLAAHDSLWRFLQRACAPEPMDRFADAEEMADALHGVLCQVASATDGLPRPRTSNRFSPPRPRLGSLEVLDWRSLPWPLLPNHPRLANRVAGVADADARTAIGLAADADELSWADLAALARAHAELGDLGTARDLVDRLDPRSADAEGFGSTLAAARQYLAGMIALAGKDPAEAVACFDTAYAAAPGEAACALALGIALAATGEAAAVESAADLFEEVATADPSWVLSVSGLASALVTLDRSPEAARVLTAVPDSHPSRAEALTMACRTMEQAGFDPMVADAVADRLRAAGSPRSAADAELAVRLYQAALAALRRGEPLSATVAGASADRPSLAKAAEQALLDMADATTDRRRRHAVLDEAARTRPWSFW
jgi:serine/threonine-protein kinase PknG